MIPAAIGPSESPKTRRGGANRALVPRVSDRIPCRPASRRADDRGKVGWVVSEDHERETRGLASFGQDWVDPSFLEIDQHGLQYESSKLTALYHHFILRRCIAMAKLAPGMRVLDYGCGERTLRRYLPEGVRYTGFDVVPRLSDLEDPRIGQWDCIFVIQVMMYFDERGVREWVEAFRYHTKQVVVALPSRNFLKDRVLDPLFGLDAERERLVRAEPATIYRQLAEGFSRTKSFNAAWMGEITRWRAAGEAT